MLAAANRNGGKRLDWAAVNASLPDGTPTVDSANFKGLFDNDPEIKKYVHGFDGTGIDLAVTNPGVDPGQRAKTGPDLVDKMAKSATKKALKAS
jgi:hypothetical protein